MLRALCILTFLLAIPVTGWSASSRDEGTTVSRTDSFVKSAYSDMITIVRALLSSRTLPNTNAAANSNSNGRVSPRFYQQATTVNMLSGTNTNTQDWPIQTKQQYINFLKNSFTGSTEDCSDKYNKYNTFFGHDSSLTGQISPKDTSKSTDRLDTMCNFLDYSHWCFALGFSYGIRDFENYHRAQRGYKCYTYQEFCESRNKTYDTSKIDEYLSKIIDEIVFYNKNIKNTDKNIVQITTEKMVNGSLVSSNSWKNYDTDKWVNERISVSEMTRLLCK